MKKLLVILLFFISTFSFAQTTKQAPPTECPPGTHAQIGIDLSQLHFHRAKRECEHGFGLCCAPSSCFYVKCTPDDFDPHVGAYRNSNFAWASIIDNKMRIWIPAGIKDMETYLGEDFSIFYIDEKVTFNYEGRNITIENGEYQVEENETYLFVEINLEL